MYKDKRIRSFVFFGSGGCLLPFLIIFNLFFGWIFLKPLHWLVSEAILLLIFIINGYILMRKIASATSKRDDVIDIKGEVIEEKRKLK